MIGKAGKSAVATLVERTSRMLALVPLSGRDALTVGDAVIAAAGTLPPQLARSLTWDCGCEMAGHARITAAGLPVYFARPALALAAGQQREREPYPARILPKTGEIAGHIVDYPGVCPKISSTKRDHFAD